MIKTETFHRVAEITLNRPERRNALSDAMVEQLVQELERFDGDDAIGAIVITGAAPSFCAGSDLKELGGMSADQMAKHEARTAAAARSIGLMNKPVIAAVEGYAIGGGFILAVSCDLVVCSEDAVWNLAEVPNGWLPPWGLGALLARVGPVAARRLTWGFERLSGRDLQQLGVVDYCVPAGEAVTKARDLAASIAELPPAAVTSTKQFFARAATGDAEYLDAHANRVFIENCHHDQARATLARFGRK